METPIKETAIRAPSKLLDKSALVASAQGSDVKTVAKRKRRAIISPDETVQSSVLPTPTPIPMPVSTVQSNTNTATSVVSSAIKSSTITTTTEKNPQPIDEVPMATSTTMSAPASKPAISHTTDNVPKEAVSRSAPIPTPSTELVQQASSQVPSEATVALPKTKNLVSKQKPVSTATSTALQTSTTTMKTLQQPTPSTELVQQAPSQAPPEAKVALPKTKKLVPKQKPVPTATSTAPQTSTAAINMVQQPTSTALSVQAPSQAPPEAKVELPKTKNLVPKKNPTTTISTAPQTSTTTMKTLQQQPQLTKSDLPKETHANLDQIINLEKDTPSADPQQAHANIKQIIDLEQDAPIADSQELQSITSQCATIDTDIRPAVATVLHSARNVVSAISEMDPWVDNIDPLGVLVVKDATDALLETRSDYHLSQIEHRKSLKRNLEAASTELDNAIEGWNTLFLHRIDTVRAMTVAKIDEQLEKYYQYFGQVMAEVETRKKARIQSELESAVANASAANEEE